MKLIGTTTSPYVRKVRIVMAGFFEAVERWRGEQARGGQNDSAIGLAFATHPATAERIAFFKAAAE